MTWSIGSYMSATQVLRKVKPRVLMVAKRFMYAIEQMERRVVFLPGTVGPELGEVMDQLEQLKTDMFSQAYQWKEAFGGMEQEFEVEAERHVADLASLKERAQRVKPGNRREQREIIQQTNKAERALSEVRAEQDEVKELQSTCTNVLARLVSCNSG